MHGVVNSILTLQNGSLNARETTLDLFQLHKEVARRGGFRQVKSFFAILSDLRAISFFLSLFVQPHDFRHRGIINSRGAFECSLPFPSLIRRYLLCLKSVNLVEEPKLLLSVPCA